MLSNCPEASPDEHPDAVERTRNHVRENRGRPHDDQQSGDPERSFIDEATDDEISPPRGVTEKDQRGSRIHAEHQ